MATTYGTPVAFTKEKNVWTLSARILFDANGAASLDTSNSKGFCAVWQNTPIFTGGTSNSLSIVGSVSSFQGLFSGMNLTIATAATFLGTTTIASITPSLASNASFNVSRQAVFDIPGPLTFIAGSAGGATGQYILQLGQQAATRLDTYVKILGISYSWDETTGSATGQALQMQLAPNAPNLVLIQDKVKVRTIPATAATGSTDATITFQLGKGWGQEFTARVPAPGEALRVVLTLGNSYNT